ncbi:MAG: bifunctional riboflavin kinase/FAD synthetase [Coleofasciculus sp. B1-GNL1-01]|uniref:bifunctional riboflavin kinase/FAD synthetase n=1 Tax=Coleofasciculus sp. B1-GNL1-01 TaxID=3068484 RepID=UPI00330418B5
MWVTSSLATALTPTAVALGNFDGIHRGHQQVIHPILQHSSLLPGQSEPIHPQERVNQEGEHIYPTLATFYPHPREFFSGQPWKLLTPKPEKVDQLKRLGIEQLVLLPFDRELAALSPEQFVDKILIEQLRATHVSIGEDFRFGYRRTGTAKDLQAIAATYGVKVSIVTLQTCQGERISSSLIRKSLEEGDILKANRLLGRPYSIRGQVIKGQQLGRTIGFPTANLEWFPDKFLPRNGVYCVRVSSPSVPEQWGVMNIGERPTVKGTCLTVESHLLNWSGDLYGQTITVSLEQFLRPEQKFASLDDLRKQIQADCAATITFFESQQ